MFHALLNEVLQSVPPTNQARFVLCTSQPEYSIVVPFMPHQRLTTERVLTEMEQVVQSHKEWRLSQAVDVNVIHVEMPRGEKWVETKCD